LRGGEWGREGGGNMRTGTHETGSKTEPPARRSAIEQVNATRQ
jgi:hypothetical protein